MKKVLTVTVPAYNVERYLNQTLESFVHEDIMQDVEVLIIDDGSKDGTALIGKQYEQKYPDTFRVISKKNGGHGSTINRGIREAQGNYFKVVDGDDWVNTSDFVELVRGLKSCTAEYVVTNYYEVNDKSGEKTSKDYKKLGNKKIWKFEEAASLVQIGMHSLVIKTEILKDNHIYLDENCFYVDVEYILYPVPYINTVQFLDLYVYMYRLAVTTQSVSIQGYQKHMDDHINVIYHLTKFYNHYAKSGISEKTNYIGKRIAQMVGDQITIFVSFPETDQVIKQKFIEFDRKLQELSPEIYGRAGKESSTLRMLRKTRFKGYKWIVRLCRQRNHVGKE